MINFVIIAISIVVFIMYVLGLKNNKFTIKDIIIVAMFSGLSIILYMVPLVRYPQGGGITFFSMIPTMLLSILYGNILGVTGGLIFGLLKLINVIVIVHPLQFLLDYMLSTMALGLAGVFKNDKKYKTILSCVLAVVLSVTINIVSGAVFFGQYAPGGMNKWLYSFIYNVSSAGLEGVLSIILIGMIPIKLLKKYKA